MRVLAAVLLLLAVAAQADPLIDLRNTLAQLPATTMVRGSFEVTSTSRSDDDAPTDVGRANVGFEVSDAGLRILYSKSMIAQATQEARGEAADPDRQTPTRLGVNQLRPLHIAELVDGAAYLLVTLDNAQLLETSQSTHRGKPARLLKFKVAPKFSKQEKKHMKKFDMTLSVWLGPDGVPIAAERKTYWKASMLLISVERDEQESWTFARTGDRLVTTRFEERSKSKGLGQNGDAQIVEVLTLQ